jgi:hypothetical protein
MAADLITTGLTVTIEGIDEAGAPRCTISLFSLRLLRLEWLCQRPASQRVAIRCSRGHVNVEFACDRCLRALLLGRLKCGYCHRGVRSDGAS